jgi:hypothetical protein
MLTTVRTGNTTHQRHNCYCCKVHVLHMLAAHLQNKPFLLLHNNKSTTSAQRNTTKHR